MTTNVYDSIQGVMTSDSRWSIRYGKYLLYVDDVRFEKIERYKDSVFMFAGNGLKIQAWKDWIRSNPADGSGMPACEEMCVCIANQTTKQVLFRDRQDIVKEGGFFAGSGSIYAYQCWVENKNAKMAVETAKQFDHSSGGDVKFLEFETGTTNLFSPARDLNINDVGQAISIRGNVMEIAVKSTGTVVPRTISELAANDPALKDIQGKIASGEIAPTAPCDGMYSEWTNEQKTQLKSALGVVFGWK